MVHNSINISGDRTIHYEPCSCREHQGNMYQRMSCTKIKHMKLKIKRQAIYCLLWLYKEKMFLTKDICYEIQKFF